MQQGWRNWVALLLQALISLILDDAMFTSAMKEFEVRPHTFDVDFGFFLVSERPVSGCAASSSSSPESAAEDCCAAHVCEAF